MSDAKKLLILSARVGAGHLRAAEAVGAALSTLAPSSEVQVVDALTFAPRLFRRIYGMGYFDVIRAAPYLVGYLYDHLDGPGEQPLGDALRRLIDRLNLRRLSRLIVDGGWDGILNTHFLTAEIVSLLKKSGRYGGPQMTVTTDFDTHRLWVQEPCELYTTATSSGAAHLVEMGVPRNKIQVTGIPIHPVFQTALDRAALRAKHQCPPEKPVVVAVSGGIGFGPLETILRQLLLVPESLTLIVCGGADALVKKLSAIPTPSRHTVRLLGFTRHMDELLAAADLVVSKPGGLTVSESLARGVPMVMLEPIPGQEERNCDFVLETGAGIRVRHVATLAERVGQLLKDSQRLTQMHVSALAAARPLAAQEAAKLFLQLVS